MNALEHLLLALIAILLVARVCGRALEKLHQPAVIGEMIAGILLGPTLLGHLFPQASSFLFPTASLPTLQGMGQIGALLFLFLIGVELDLRTLLERKRATLTIANAAMLFPFILGVLLALSIYRAQAPPGVGRLSFTLFLGVAMAVTAFPVLARILTDRNLHQTEIGRQALASAAVSDLLAWCLLAVVVGVARSQAQTAFQTAGLALLYFAMMFGPIRGVYAKRIGKWEAHVSSRRLSLFFALAFCLTSALVAQLVGIHALFGAFFAGVLIPHSSRLAADLRAALHDAVELLLLPIFFALVGLHTDLSLVGRAENWRLALVVIGLASLGKIGGAFVAARFHGLAGRDALALGLLLNTRGLMELVILSVGLELGVLTPALFSSFVLMALVTTSATAPLLRWFRLEPSSPSALVYFPGAQMPLQSLHRREK